MRIHRNGISPRPGSQSPQIDPLPQYFLAFEGVKTEYQYFFGIQSRQESLGFSALKDITLLQRHATKEQQSNPAKFLPLVLQSLEEYKTGSFSVKTIVEHAVDWLILKNHLPKKGCTKQKMLEILLENLENDRYSPDSPITDWDELTQKLHDHLIDLYKIRISAESIRDFHIYLKQQFVTYNPRYDKVCIIVDRDPESFTSSQYDSVLALCNEKKISLHLSNPCFEFWLLLHFPKVHELDSEEMLANRKISIHKRFLENELQKIHPEFRKNNLKFGLFADHIDDAIENESHFCEELSGLKTELGSNIGKLLSEMRSS
ncbi:RloB family protein [Methanorbis furvi]|uniref:RloB domain-containing protein n=1 Tax=Methanorbis furvi TaxID=3028299 RepID=A0AAE4MDJ9_9EURY|nr:hypothetical protein [Methanocorpusculaceae archaeon Ag1]